jgi:hypothetical protein
MADSHRPKTSLRFAAQKKLAALKQFFVLIASLHFVLSTYPLRAVLSFQMMSSYF